MDCQSSHAALSSFILVSENPGISWRGNNSGKQEIVEELALRGIRTGSKAQCSFTATIAGGDLKSFYSGTPIPARL
jgi:hypothetical protein